MLHSDRLPRHLILFISRSQIQLEGILEQEVSSGRETVLYTLLQLHFYKREEALGPPFYPGNSLSSFKSTGSSLVRRPSWTLSSSSRSHICRVSCNWLSPSILSSRGSFASWWLERSISCSLRLCFALILCREGDCLANGVP